MGWFELFFPSKHSLRLHKRRAMHKELNKIKIPDRNKLELKKIQPDLWYVIWEKNLTKPKIFRYSFISEIFARIFVDKRLRGYKYNILPGATLIGFGIIWARTKLRNVELDGSKDSLHKYSFPDGLSHQNRKTMRTLYRRNLRRLLIQKDKKKRNGRQIRIKKDRR